MAFETCYRVQWIHASFGSRLSRCTIPEAFTIWLLREDLPTSTISYELNLVSTFQSDLGFLNLKDRPQFKCAHDNIHTIYTGQNMWSRKCAKLKFRSCLLGMIWSHRCSKKFLSLQQQIEGTEDHYINKNKPPTERQILDVSLLCDLRHMIYVDMKYMGIHRYIEIR